ncbi:hypothetical protein EES45_24140 [Streptomyces sp. ADI97-07]|nr:hypothetical protein EES45_24140 [Streptomyces sp. ADI97-07]
MNNGSALRPRLLAALGAALLLTSCSSAGEDDHRTTDERASHWGKDMGAPEASAFMKVAVPESATEVKDSVCCPSGKAVTVWRVSDETPLRRGHHASLPETHARRAPRQRIHLDEGAARSPVPDHAPGTLGPSAPRRLAGQRDRRSGPSQLIPVPDALSHTLTTSIQCCSDFSDCRRTRRGRRGLKSTSSRGIALNGPTHARATKGQLTAMRDLP